MTTIRGKVNAVVSNETSFGTMYNLEVNGKSFGAGKFPPKNISEGDYIEFEADLTGRYAKMNTRTVKVVPEPAEGAAPTPTPAAGGGKVVEAGSYVSNDQKRQDNITRQASRNTASAWVQFLHSAGGISIPATKKAPAVYALLNGMLEEFTDKFVEYAQTGNLPGTSKDANAVDPDDSDETTEWQ